MPLLSPDELAAKAGVNPWKLYSQLQHGDPDEIETLASTFYKASGHTGESAAAAKKARTYVTGGYTVNDTSPLDYSSDVALADNGIKDRATRTDHLQRIGKILDAVGTDLRTATISSHSEITTMDATITGIDNDWTNYSRGRFHGDDPTTIESTRNSLIAKQVTAVKSHGTAIKRSVTSYETTLHNALKSMADLGYVPPDALDEGPGDIDVNALAGTNDGNNTIKAAKAGNTAGLKNSTFALSLVNDAIAHNNGRVSDSEYSYLYNYYNTTAKHSDVIDHAVKGNPDLQKTVGSTYADGLLNMSNGANQNTDNGTTPYATSPTDGPLGRGGLNGLPPNVLDVLHSDIGSTVDTHGTPMLRAVYENGHWVIKNYANDSGFTDLLGMASKNSHGVQNVHGSDQFLTTLGEAGLRWKQQLNTVDHNTYNWVKQDHDSDVNLGAPNIDPKHFRLPDGYTGKDDSLGRPINNDQLASQALDQVSTSSTASDDLLLNASDRRALLGMNWNHGAGAAAVITSGTAPDPTGTTQRNAATLAVMTDAAHDYSSLDTMANPDVKTALTLVATRHIDSFAQDTQPSSSGVSDQIVGPDGRLHQGIALTAADRANYLKLVTGFGPSNYGMLHAAALDEGSRYLAHGMQGGSEQNAPGQHPDEFKRMASLLNSRVTTAGVAAANDTLQANVDGHGQQFAANLLAEQKQATQDWIAKLGNDGLDTVLGVGAAVQPEVFGPMALAKGIMDTVQGDVGGPEHPGDTVDVAAIKNIQHDIGDASQITTKTAQAALDTGRNEQWMAVRAQNLLPDSYLQQHHASAAELQAHNEAGALVARNGVPSGGIFTSASPVTNTKLNDIVISTYGNAQGLPDTSTGSNEDEASGQGQNLSWGGSHHVDPNARSLNNDDGSWGNHKSAYSIAYGDNHTYGWKPWSAPDDVNFGGNPPHGDDADPTKYSP